MYLLGIDDEGITLVAPDTATQRCKEIPGARRDHRARLWRYPKSVATCVVARGVFGAELEVSDELKAWAVDEFARVKDAMRAREEAMTVVRNPD